MLNILLVDDDEHFRAVVASILEDEKWKVVTAPNGRSAREILVTAKPFDLIISDIQMPYLSGVELLQWVKENKPTPFVLMTGFALIMETQKAHDLGADQFLSKPFETEELIAVVKDVCAAKLALSEVKPVAVESEYCKVSLEEFVSSNKIQFDVYVKLGSHFVRIGRRDDAVPRDRIDVYKEKGLKHLYVKKQDFQQLVTFNLELAKRVATTSQIPPEKKANFLRYTGEVVLEKAFLTGLSQESFADAQSYLQTSMDVLANDDLEFSVIESLNAHSDFLYAHSLCVSIYSVMIAREMGWTSSANLFRLSLAGLFHDIGKKEVDREILLKPRPLLTRAERTIIESHAERGREILLQLPRMPSEVIAVAYEHHEDNLGTGFPRRLGKTSIHPMAQIVHVADLFAEFTLKTPKHQGMDPQGAILHMIKNYQSSCMPEAFRALMRMFKVAAAA